MSANETSFTYRVVRIPESSYPGPKVTLSHPVTSKTNISRNVPDTHDGADPLACPYQDDDGMTQELFPIPEIKMEQAQTSGFVSRTDAEDESTKENNWMAIFHQPSLRSSLFQDFVSAWPSPDSNSVKFLTRNNRAIPLTISHDFLNQVTGFPIFDSSSGQSYCEIYITFLEAFSHDLTIFQHRTKYTIRINVRPWDHLRDLVSSFDSSVNLEDCFVIQVTFFAVVASCCHNETIEQIKFRDSSNFSSCLIHMDLPEPDFHRDMIAKWTRSEQNPASSESHDDLSLAQAG